MQAIENIFTKILKIQIKGTFIKEPSGNFRKLQKPSGTFKNLQEPSYKLEFQLKHGQKTLGPVEQGLRS